MIAQNLKKVQARIHAVDKNQQVSLIAVSKTKTTDEIQQAIDVGQRHFGENYLQEALAKIAVLNAKNQDLVWHFIGSIQSNKTAKIAKNFTWVHGVDSIKIAKRLNHQRPENLAKLNILLQVNIDNAPRKSGISVSQIEDMVVYFKNFDKLILRGFMCIPNTDNLPVSFAKMAVIFKQYSHLDSLSMGMSGDLELAIKNAATMVRVGSDIFGKRNVDTQ